MNTLSSLKKHSAARKRAYPAYHYNRPRDVNHRLISQSRARAFYSRAIRRRDRLIASRFDSSFDGRIFAFAKITKNRVGDNFPRAFTSVVSVARFGRSLTNLLGKAGDDVDARRRLRVWLIISKDAPIVRGGCAARLLLYLPFVSLRLA